MTGEKRLNILGSRVRKVEWQVTYQTAKKSQSGLDFNIHFCLLTTETRKAQRKAKLEPPIYTCSSHLVHPVNPVKCMKVSSSVRARLRLNVFLRDLCASVLNLNSAFLCSCEEKSNLIYVSLFRLRRMRWFLTEGHWRTAFLFSDIIPINGALSSLNFSISDVLFWLWYELATRSMGVIVRLISEYWSAGAIIIYDCRLRCIHSLHGGIELLNLKSAF